VIVTVGVGVVVRVVLNVGIEVVDGADDADVIGENGDDPRTAWVCRGNRRRSG